MIICTPDTELIFSSSLRSVFLAGTIDNGNSFDWQNLVIQRLQDIDCIVYNPRKSSWNPKLNASSASETLRKQVDWEQTCIFAASEVFFNFEAGSVSPISLLEYGQCFATGKSTIVRCPTAYFRHGNIKIMQDSIQEPTFIDLDKAIQFLKQSLSS